MTGGGGGEILRELPEGGGMRSAFVTSAVLIALAAPASAQLDGFGLGLIGGDPTGLCMKYWLSGESALEAIAAWSFDGDGGFFLAVDYDRHAFGLDDDPGSDLGGLYLSYGLGARMHFREDDDHDEGDGDDFRLGIRIPLALVYPFEGAPVDLFLQLAPAVDLVPETELRLNGGVGARLYL